MPHAFAPIAYTPQANAQPQRDGSRAGGGRSVESDADTLNDRLPLVEPDFLSRLRFVCMAPVSETDWPCVQGALDAREIHIAEVESRP